MGYEYYDQIKSPNQLGMSGNGSMGTLSKNVESLVDYVRLLIEGGGSASKTGQPLGNKYFSNTNAKCVDVDTGKDVDRYMYIDNQPDGSMPMIGAGMGQSFNEFRGLIPGILDDINDINPERIVDAFMESGKPKCRRVTLEVIADNGATSYQSQYVPDPELENVAPCNFQDKRNPVTGKTCSEGFTGSMREMSSFGQGSMFEMDALAEEVYYHGMNSAEWKKQVMIGGTSVVLLYFLWKMYTKR